MAKVPTRLEVVWTLPYLNLIINSNFNNHQSKIKTGLCIPVAPTVANSAAHRPTRNDDCWSKTLLQVSTTQLHCGCGDQRQIHRQQGIGAFTCDNLAPCPSRTCAALSPTRQRRRPNVWPATGSTPSLDAKANTVARRFLQLGPNPEIQNQNPNGNAERVTVNATSIGTL